MKQDVDTESLQNIGLILAIFQLLHTAVICRKEAAIPNYSGKKKKKSAYPDVFCSS